MMYYMPDFLEEIDITFSAFIASLAGFPCLQVKNVPCGTSGGVMVGATPTTISRTLIFLYYFFSSTCY
jgi:hypothetical protein